MPTATSQPSTEWLTPAAEEATRAAIARGDWVMVLGLEWSGGTAVAARILSDLGADRYLRAYRLKNHLEEALACPSSLVLRNSQIDNSVDFEAQLSCLLPSRPDLVAAALERVTVVVQPQGLQALEDRSFHLIGP